MVKETKQFYYLGGNGIQLFRLRQLTTLHHVASKLKYDSDCLYLIHNHLIKMKEPPDSLERVIEWRKSLDPK